MNGMNQLKIIARKMENRHALWCADKYTSEVIEQDHDMPKWVAAGLLYTMTKICDLPFEREALCYSVSKEEWVSEQQSPFVAETHIWGDPSMLGLNEVRQAFAWNNQNWVMAVLGMLNSINAPMNLQESTAQWAHNIGYGQQISALEQFRGMNTNMRQKMADITAVCKETT